MKVTVPIAALLLAAAVGYILGTETGRARRDDLLVRLGRGTAAATDQASDETIA
jgi:hypothetical protein